MYLISVEYHGPSSVNVWSLIKVSHLYKLEGEQVEFYEIYIKYLKIINQS